MTHAAPEGAGRLHVVADLHLSVEDHSVSVTGDGSELTVRTAKPASLLTLVADSGGGGSVSLRRVAARAGTLLAESGLSVRVVGDHGTLVDFGAGPDSRIGRLLVGSDHARLGSPRALLPIATAAVRTRVRIEHLAGGLVLAAVLIGIGSRRRS